MECSPDILDVEPSHDRKPRQPHRLPAPVPRRRLPRQLIDVRWPNGFRCPACGHNRGWELKTRKHSFECARCHRQASVAAGPLLHRTRLSLAIRFRAAHLMATHCNGISALQLQKLLGIESCRSAWMLAAKLRRAMVTPECSPLSGLVGIDEASLPQRDKGAPPGPGRSPEGKMPVAGAVELGGCRGRLPCPRASAGRWRRAARRLWRRRRRPGRGRSIRSGSLSGCSAATWFGIEVWRGTRSGLRRFWAS